MSDGVAVGDTGSMIIEVPEEYFDDLWDLIEEYTEHDGYCELDDMEISTVMDIVSEQLGIYYEDVSCKRYVF